MNFLIERLNGLGHQAQPVAWAMLWQSSLLIVLLLIVDWSLGRKLRPTVRYALWLLVLVKLVLPPSLAAPTGVAWWVRPPIHTARVHLNAPAVVTYGPATLLAATQSAAALTLPKPAVSIAGGVFAGSVAISLALFGFVLIRWRQVARLAATGQTKDAPVRVMQVLDEARKAAGVRRRVTLRMVRTPMSPALFGLFRPVVLLPESLAQQLSAARLRSVLLHELIHFRRGDVWVNCAQALLQILYWWHPLVWVANSRIRRSREEAVDEAVMSALGGDAEDYAPTLIDVARMALDRPLASLGLIGILESHGALRQRLERLMNFSPAQSAHVTVIAIVCGVAVGALALPMGQATAPEPGADTPAAGAGQSTDQLSKQSTPGDRTQLTGLVADGKLLYEMGKLAEAEKKLTEALQQNPREQAAYYYLHLVKEARSKEQGGLRKTSPGRQRIYSKLQNIQLDTLGFDNTSLAEVITTLQTEARLRDPAGEGINFFISQAPGPGDEKGAQNLDKVTVRLLTPLLNVRLGDALDAILKTADRPIKYSIEDYAIVFSFKGNEATPLYTRVIKVDPNTVKNALNSALGKSKVGSTQDTVNLLREFLASINVDLSPPKSIFVNEREGSILVRGSLQDLDTIEAAIQVLNMAPPQLNIKTRFLEMSESEETAFWSKYSAANQLAQGPRMVQLNHKDAQSQFEDWESKGSADLLHQASITTLSGRQASVQLVDIQNIVTYTNGSPVTNAVPLGPVLDVLPTVSADTFRFDLAMTASINEFLGYEKSDNDGSPTPHFRLRQMPVTTTVWDGHTLVIGGALDEQNQPADKPGDNRKRLLVAITPTVIDPAGNRVHTDEEVDKALSKMGVPAR